MRRSKGKERREDATSSSSRRRPSFLQLRFASTVFVLPPRVYTQRFISVEKSHARKSVLDLSERERREKEVVLVASKLIDLVSYRSSFPPSRSMPHSHAASFPYTATPSRRSTVVVDRGKPTERRRGRKERGQIFRTGA